MKQHPNNTAVFASCSFFFIAFFCFLVCFLAGGPGIAIGLFFLAVALLIPFIGMIYRSRKHEDKEKRPSNVPDMDLFPQELNNGQRLYKYYSRIEICVIEGKEPDFSALHAGDRLELKQEKSNKFDLNAVAVYDGRQRIGYLFRGIGQDMSNDFINHGNIIVAYLSEINAKEKRLTMNIAYYRKPYKTKKSGS